MDCKKNKIKNRKDDRITTKEVFIIVQPDHFNDESFTNTQKVKRIIVLDICGKVLLDDVFNCDSYLFVRHLLADNVQLITYNGELLSFMLWKFWNWNRRKHIKDLMKEFAVIYGEKKGWYNRNDDSLYIWQKLATALNYYGVEDCAVDIYDPMEVITKTAVLYEEMERGEKNESEA